MSLYGEAPTGTVSERIGSADAADWQKATARAIVNECGGCTLRLCRMARDINEERTKEKPEQALTALKLIVGNPYVAEVHIPCDKEGDCPGVILSLDESDPTAISTTYCFDD